MLLIQGWHVTAHFVPLTTFASSAEWSEFLSDIAGYMSRLFAILKHTTLTLQLSILIDEAGDELRKLMDEVQNYDLLLCDADV